MGRETEKERQPMEVHYQINYYQCPLTHSPRGDLGNGVKYTPQRLPTSGMGGIYLKHISISQLGWMKFTMTKIP